MKRHKCLIALSHDHHHGLLLAQLLKDDAPDYKGLPKDVGDKIKHALISWRKELKQHFANEEKILFPFIKGRDNELDKLISEIIGEHRIIKSLFDTLEKNGNKSGILNKIGVALESHIRKEERILFQKVQQVFTKIELDTLTGKIIPVKESLKK